MERGKKDRHEERTDEMGGEGASEVGPRGGKSEKVSSIFRRDGEKNSWIAWVC
jgi:hypothetical protein